jgi:protoporphyrin/coproporphyrin ferrochelatase
MSATSYDGVLLIGFGGPTRLEEVRPFLDNLLKGRRVPRDRYEEVVRHYEALGGRSPFTEITMRQAEALRLRLEGEGLRLPVLVGMLNTEPNVRNVIREMAERGIRRVFGFVLAAYRSEVSWNRYLAAVGEAQGALGDAAPTVDYPPPWHDHPLFIQAVAAQVSAALARLSPDERSRAELVFTAHSIRVAMASASPYVEQYRESSRLVAEAVGHKSWRIAFQSRSGDPREPWLEPDIFQTLRSLAGRPAVVVPIGFLCDHLEVLYDLDIQAAAVAREAGVHMERAATVNDHPRFIEMIASIVRARSLP